MTICKKGEKSTVAFGSLHRKLSGWELPKPAKRYELPWSSWSIFFKTTYWVSDFAVPFRVSAILDDRSLKVFCEMFRTWEKKRLNLSKRAIVFKILATAHFPPKLLAAFCSSHEVLFSSLKRITSLRNIALSSMQGKPDEHIKAHKE